MMNNIPDLIKESMASIKDMVGSEQIIGKPITTENGDIIIPVTQVTVGFGAGGSDIPSKKAEAANGFGGGTGGGVRIKPVAFLVISGGKIKLIPVKEESTAVDKVLDLVPDLLDKANEIIDSKKKDKNKSRAE